ncbi:MAG TPA: hypothetical protein DCO75_05810 [Fibrobacteres bacterium]|nr:hypothetical protein [Fibrobacterota bacterium]
MINTNNTGKSRRHIPDIKDIVPRFPPISYSVVSVDKLIFPSGLFDMKNSGHSGIDAVLVLPVIAIREEASDKLVVIDGCKRVARLLKDNEKTCACGIVSGPIDMKTAGLFRILLNKNRQLNIGEKVCFYKWLKKNYSGDAFNDIATILGFPASICQELAPLVDCREKIFDAVNTDRLALKYVPDFCRMDESDQNAFLDSFTDILLSNQTQREFLEWLPEIAYTKKTSVAAILQSTDIQNIIKDTVLNNPQKTEAIRNILFSLKFPMYNEALKTWKKTASEVSRAALKNEPSSRLLFTPGAAFEKNNLEIRLTISYAGAAKEIFRKLSEVPKETWSRLIYPVVE